VVSSPFAPAVAALSVAVLASSLAAGAPAGLSGPSQPTPEEAATAAALGVPVGPLDNLKARAEAFSRFRDPAGGAPAALGSTSNGCLIGGVALPRSGPGYELVRLGRNRRFGHPALIAYIQRLGAAARRAQIGTLLIGDLGQPRGGPTPTGHRSHQSGLDVDIGFTRPAWVGSRAMKASEREQMSQLAVVDLTTRTFTAEWSPKVAQLVQLAASDPEVDRIFVHPRVKRELCDLASQARASRKGPDAAAEASWLRTVRPWWGHHDHLHVRLKCPADSAGCESQPPLPPGDGCGEIAWWESEEARRGREPRRDPALPIPPPPPLPPLPSTCQALLDAASPAKPPPTLRASALPAP
jgi:penicillin-insensitive murein DD-endopeptidase